MLNDNTSLTLYLNSMGDHALLTRAEEQKLARKAQKGDEEAVNLLVKHNLRLVVKIANEFDFGVVDILDLISEGNIGLQKAAQRFKPGQGSKFSTYAIWWIKQNISRAIANQAKHIRVPVHMQDMQRKLQRVKNNLEGELGRTATTEEISEATGIDGKRIDTILSTIIPIVSLHAPISHDGEDGGELGDFIEDQSILSPEEQLQKKTSIEWAQKLLDSLTNREKIILEKRFGLNGNQEETLEVVGAQLGVTRERIRQIQDKALRKLRNRFERITGIPFELKDLLNHLQN